MGMATGSWYEQDNGAPRKLGNDLMYCPKCEAQYRRGGWARYRRAPKGDTTGTHGSLVGVIPDDQCPICGNKEKSAPNPEGATP